MTRRVEVDVGDVAILLATVSDLCVRSGRKPSPRIDAVIDRIRRACDAQPVTEFDPDPDLHQHSAYDLMSSAEAGAILGITPHAVRALRRRGVLAGHPAGNRYLIPARLVIARAEQQAAKQTD